MRLSHHGGMCCGIKHIFEMGTDPANECREIDVWDDDEGRDPSADVCYNWTTQCTTAYPNDIPRETYLDRLDRYLDYLKDKRPSGVVEITLITDGGIYNQSKWVPIITERGFREVSPDGGVYNSNSGNRVRIFHLYLSGGYPLNG